MLSPLCGGCGELSRSSFLLEPAEQLGEEDGDVTPPLDFQEKMSTILVTAVLVFITLHLLPELSTTAASWLRFWPELVGTESEVSCVEADRSNGRDFSTPSLTKTRNLFHGVIWTHIYVFFRNELPGQKFQEAIL